MLVPRSADLLVLPADLLKGEEEEEVVVGRCPTLLVRISRRPRATP